MKRSIVYSLVAGLLLAATAAPAQAQEESPPLTVEVESIHVPATIGKLVSKGVRVNASCSADCIIVVKVSLPPSVASKLGLSKTVIGTGVTDATANEVKTIRAKVRAGAGRRLEDYNGSKNLRVRVQALP
jgi:hypothetical protein